MAWQQIFWSSDTSEKSPVEATKSMRIDAFLAQHLSDYSRTFIQHLIKTSNGIRVNRRLIHQCSQKINTLDVIEIDWEELESKERQHIPAHLSPWVCSELDQAIIFEDEDILIINKPVGVMVHPGAGEWQQTLVNWLLSRYGLNWQLAEAGTVVRPGIVHRLDKNTSGVMVIAKNTEALLDLQQQIKQRQINRIYYALVFGNWHLINGVAEGQIECFLERDPVNRTRFRVQSEILKNENNLKSRYSLSKYKVISSQQQVSLLKFKLATGRTHQIRIHCEWMGCPIIGDSVYCDLLRGQKRSLAVLPADIKRNADGIFKGQALHAWKLALIHPKSKKSLIFYAPVPESFKKFFKALAWDVELGTPSNL